MNSFFRHAICNEVFKDWNFDDACKAIRAAGYTGIEIAPFTLAEDPATVSQERRREYKEMMAGEGLAFVGLHWIMVSPKGLHVTTPDEASPRPKLASYPKSRRPECRPWSGFGDGLRLSLPAGVHGRVNPRRGDPALSWTASASRAPCRRARCHHPDGSAPGRANATWCRPSMKQLRWSRDQQPRHPDHVRQP